jgi:WD40 repeat protein
VVGDRYEIFFGILAEVVAKWLRTRSQIRQLAQDAEKAWQEFDFSQLGALQRAIKAGDALQDIIEEDKDWSKDSATIAVRKTLQVILENIREEWLFKHPNSPIYGASISTEGKLATASFDGTVRLWDLEKFQEEASNEFQDPSKSVFCVTFSADGQQLATGSWDGTVRLWDLEGNQLLSDPLGKPGEPAVSSVSFSPNGRQLAIASLDGIIRLWNLQGSPSEMQHIQPEALTPFIQSLSFLSQGGQLVIAYWDGLAYLWDWQQNKLFRLGEHQRQSEEPQAQFGEPQLLAIGSQDGLVRLWNAANPSEKPTEEFKAHNAPICHASYDASTDELDTVSWDGKVRRWQLKDKTWREFSCNRSPVYRGSFSPDRKHLVTVASDGGAHLWSLTDDYSSRLGTDQLAVCQAGQAAVYCVSFSSDGKLATASLDKTVRLYNSQGEPIADPIRFESPVYRVSFSPDGRYLGIALADPQGTACLLHIDSGKQIEYSKHKQTVYCMSFNRDSDRIASASGDGTVHLWDLQGNPLQAPLSPQKGTIYYVSFSPDAQKLAMAFVDGTVGLWDFQSGDKTECMGHASVVFCLNFSPDGKLLATASGDGTVRLWDLEGNEKAKFRHESSVYWVSFSRDGELLATASGDGKTCLWQVKDGKEVAEFKHHEAQVYSVCFSPDGQQVATASQDGSVKLRRIENLEALLERGRERLKGAFL